MTWDRKPFGSIESIETICFVFVLFPGNTFHAERFQEHFKVAEEAIAGGFTQPRIVI